MRIVHRWTASGQFRYFSQKSSPSSTALEQTDVVAYSPDAVLSFSAVNNPRLIQSQIGDAFCCLGRSNEKLFTRSSGLGVGGRFVRSTPKSKVSDIGWKNSASLRPWNDDRDAGGEMLGDGRGCSLGLLGFCRPRGSITDALGGLVLVTGALLYCRVPSRHAACSCKLRAVSWAELPLRRTCFAGAELSVKSSLPNCGVFLLRPLGLPMALSKLCVQAVPSSAHLWHFGHSRVHLTFIRWH